jgi:hypothetical protein
MDVSMKLQELLNGDLKNYQSIPFWSWNDKLDSEELRRQIRHMKSVGIGGFFMHARGGLKTEYMGEEWFEATAACIDEAEKQNMNAWCYDENGWPSGFAGMKLLDDEKNHVHYLTLEYKESFDNTALAVYYIDNTKLIRLTAPTDGVKEYICIYDKTNPSVVDILNEDVVKKFIDETHEKYYARFKKDFGNVLLGFFTDEPQYYRWGTAYTPCILNEYKKAYNENLLDRLAALLVDCNDAYELRYRYWLLMNKLYINSFAKQVYEWCENHNCKLTGHSIEESSLAAQMWCSAGVMPFYEYEQIPGIDWLRREISDEMSPRQVSSVAMQLGKKQILTETFACTGWDVTPKELKRIAEWQYVNGVNLTCQHLYPYSIRGQRKRDYPTFFSEHNPWIKYFKHFNDYFTTIGYMLTESKEVAKVAIIHPIHSAYLTYNDNDNINSVKELEVSFKALVEKFGAANIGHHYIDELLLEKHGKVENNKLIMGLCEYDYVVIPQMQNLDSNTVKMLKEYIENGGKLWLAGEKPCYVDGKKKELDFLNSNITFEDMYNNDVLINDFSTTVRSTYRKANFGDFIYAVNTSKETPHSVSFYVNAKGAKLFDLEQRAPKPLYFEKTENGIVIPLSFKATQSYVIMIDDNALPCENKNITGTSIDIGTNAEIVSVTENSLTLDYAAISYDNINYEKPLPIAAIFDRLLRERQNRKVYLKYTFNIKEIPDTIFLEAEKTDIENVWLNNENIKNFEKGTIDLSFIRKNIKKNVKIGINEIVFEINYFQAEYVYSVLFDITNGTESLMNCLSYDTDIEAIYIRGDFFVDSDGYTRGDKNTSISNSKFEIVKSKREINVARINDNGYPFFAGEIIFQKEFYVDKTDYNLHLLGRFSIAEVFVNDNYVGILMFDDTCDISRFLLKGKNILKIKLTNSNRNLLGPFHFKKDPDPYGVAPGTFLLTNTWENGESPLYTHSYAFTHFGLTKIKLLKQANSSIIISNKTKQKEEEK